MAITTGIGISTAYRYLHEGIDTLAAAAPDLHQVLDQAKQHGWAHLTLDGTLIETDRANTRKGQRQPPVVLRQTPPPGRLVQVVCDPTGFPVWSICGRTGQRAQHHHSPRACPARVVQSRRRGDPTRADKGDIGAGIGIKVPFNGRNLAIDNQSHNAMLSDVRADDERAHSILKTTWPTLQRVTLCPTRIDAIVAAAAIVVWQWQRGHN